MCLGSQRCVFDKAGLGYNPMIKQKEYQTFFVKDTPSSSSTPKIIYMFEGNKRVKKIWVPKGTSLERTNNRGPKMVWVPKKVT